MASSKIVAQFFESCVELYDQPKKVANWVINEFLRLIKGDEDLIAKSPVTPAHVAKTLQLVDQGAISITAAKTVLAKVHETGDKPEDIIQKEGLSQVSDEGALETIIDEILTANPSEVERFKAGNDKLQGFFVGQIMKKSGGRANPAKVNELLRKKLSGS